MRIKNLITDKIVAGAIHAPDLERNSHWPKLLRYYLSREARKAAKRSQIELITWNNLGDGPLEQCCARNDYSLVVYGKEVTAWSNYLKFTFNIQACRETKAQYVMGCDAHDVILLSSPEDILEGFLQFNCKMLFNAERYFYPNIPEPVVQEWKQYEEQRYGGFPYLNAGVWIGETEFVKEFFSECNKVRVHDLFDCSNYRALRKDFIGCDQSSIHATFPKFWPDVQLDSQADLFLNIANLGVECLEYQGSLL
jgi:hypothetical protein